MEAVSAPTAKKPAIGVMGWRGSLATGTTFTSALNSERLTVAWYKGAVESNAIIAASYAAIIASEEDPARPLNTLLKAISNKLKQFGKFKGENPLNGLKLFRQKEKKLIFLRSQKIDRPLNACQKINNDLLLVVKLCLTTGARWSDLLSFRPFSFRKCSHF